MALKGKQNYDGLITDVNPAVFVAGATIRKGAAEASYVRGTIFAKSNKDSKLVILGSTPAEAESNADPEVLTPYCILCEDITVGTDADENAAVFTAGCFDPEKLVAKEDYTITEADKDALRNGGIFLKAATK